jgi:hypothetical protein
MTDLTLFVGLDVHKKTISVSWSRFRWDGGAATARWQAIRDHPKPGIISSVGCASPDGASQFNVGMYDNTKAMTEKAPSSVSVQYQRIRRKNPPNLPGREPVWERLYHFNGGASRFGISGVAALFGLVINPCFPIDKCELLRRRDLHL